MNQKTDFELTNCKICNSNDFLPYSAKGQFGLETNVVICKKCGFSYLNPRWTIERYNQFYAKEYDTYYREETVNRPNNNLEYNNIKAILSRLKAANTLPQNPNSILDIGCGMGHSLIYLKNEIFKQSNYFAIEPSEFCVNHLKKNGIEVITNNVFSDWDKSNEKKFDFIIMRHVLEHFNEPIEVLKKVKSVLKDNGILFLAVPNSMKPTKPLKSFYFRVVHVSYFSPKSLKNTLVLAGLNCKQIVDGDAHEPFEVYAICNADVTNEKLDLLETEWQKQKNVYDEIGKNDFYYTNKFKLINFLRRIKLLK